MGDYIKKRTRRRRAPGAPRPRRTTTRRTFKRNTRLEFWRKAYDPKYLGSSDYLLYGKNLNPFRNRSQRWQRYNRGFELAQALFAGRTPTPPPC